MTKCSTCGFEDTKESNYCKKCGSKLEKVPTEPKIHIRQPIQGIKCKECGKPLSNEFTFCVSCGDPMCLGCAVIHHVSREHSYTYNYGIVEREISLTINYPRCTSCPRNEEHLTAAIKDRLRQYHPFKYRFLDVRQKKYGDRDPYINDLQNKLDWYSCPPDMLACPKCGKSYDINHYRKTLKKIKKGKIVPNNLVMAPFGEGGRLISDYLLCSECGYEGVFISGWGLKRFIQRYTSAPLEGTTWEDASRELIPKPYEALSTEQTLLEQPQQPNQYPPMQKLQPQKIYSQQYSHPQYPCPFCGQPLSYIQQYQRWYCYNCKRYV